MDRNEDSHKSMKEWETQSNRMYAGYIALFVLDGVEYMIDSGKSDEAKALGAKPRAFNLLYDLV